MRSYFFMAIEVPDAPTEREHVLDLGSGEHPLNVFVAGDGEPFEVNAPCGAADLAEAFEAARAEGFAFVLVDGDAIRATTVSGVVPA